MINFFYEQLNVDEASVATLRSSFRISVEQEKTTLARSKYNHFFTAFIRGGDAFEHYLLYPAEKKL
jgi:hypothetical protein